LTNRLKGRLDQLTDEPGCSTCGFGKPPTRVVLRGLSPKYGAEVVEGPEPEPERCPDCGRMPPDLSIRFKGLDDKVPLVPPATDG
jgi:hypothetical protein